MQNNNILESNKTINKLKITRKEIVFEIILIMPEKQAD